MSINSIAFFLGLASSPLLPGMRSENGLSTGLLSFDKFGLSGHRLTGTAVLFHEEVSDHRVLN